MKQPTKLMIAFLPFILSSQVCAANAVYTQPESIPTLSEFGLIGLIIAISIAAGLTLRRFAKKTSA